MHMDLQARLRATAILASVAAIVPSHSARSQASGSQVAAQPSPPQAAPTAVLTPTEPMPAVGGGQNARVPATAADGTDQDIVVSGFRSSLASALAEKKAETASVDTIKAEDIGKFPDSNLAESMQRLPGVSLTRGDGGEGRNITVRGLAAEFTRVRINGMEGTAQTGASDVYGGGNNGRSFDFNVFPSEIFTSLSVRKTPSANMEEGSLGATVDLKAPHPLDQRGDLAFTATARGIYNDVSKSFDPRISSLFSKKFADDTMGILISGSYSSRDTRDVGYSAVLVLPSQINGGFCSPIGVTPQNPATNALRGTTATNCSTGNPRTGTVAAYSAVQQRLGPQGQPGGGAFFPRLPRYLDSQQHYDRVGGSLSYQWSPDENTHLTLDGLYSRYQVKRGDSYISGLSFARSASNSGQPMTSIKDIVINDKGSVVYGLYDGVDVRSEHWDDFYTTTFKQGTLDFDHRFSDNFKISGIAGYSESLFHSPQRRYVNEDSNDVRNFSVDFRNQPGGDPAIAFGIDVANPLNFKYQPGSPDGTVYGTWSDRKLDRSTRNTTLGLDADWDLNSKLRFSAGGQYRQSIYHSVTLGLDPAHQATQQLPAGTTTGTISAQITGLDKLWGYGAPASWAYIDQAKWAQAVGLNDSWYCGVECGSDNSGVRETISSGYGMVTFDTGQMLPITIRGDAGVRYVHTDQYSFGRIPVAAPAGSRYPTLGTLAEASRSYQDWLPSVNLVGELRDNLLLRLAAAKVMSRPQLAPLIPSSGVDAVGRRGTINNPFLDPIRATTYDASLEWYFRSGSLLSIAYFQKNISTYIQSISSLIPFSQLGLPDTLLANSQTTPSELFTVNQLTNTPGGKLTGFELNAQAPFRFLPGFLSNFGGLASVTLVTSKINYILQSVNGQPTLTTTADLVGLSRKSASGTLYYEDKRVSVRGTANYRSGYIRTIPSGAQDSDYIANKPTLFVDFSASYNLTSNIKVLVEGQNLTNERNTQYIDSNRQDNLFDLRSGRTFTVGANFRL